MSVRVHLGLHLLQHLRLERVHCVVVDRLLLLLLLLLRLLLLLLNDCHIVRLCGSRCLLRRK